MEQTEYCPSFLLRNGHFNTIYTSVLRKSLPNDFIRERIATPDNDFIDVDLLANNNKRLAILCHGLEGSSKSKYILAASSKLSNENWDVVAVNYRGCSGEVNMQIKIYHSGATDDLALVVDRYKSKYKEIHLVGFSLGGNLVLKYCGETERSGLIKSVVAISTPTNLREGSLHLSRKSNLFYTKKFLQTLKKKIKQKHLQFPEVFDLSKIAKIKTVYDFDDVFTGPIHGFENADDYYQKCSSEQFIKSINIPGLIINALDDPFLPTKFYPYKAVEKNKNMRLLTPRYGGHVGFADFGKKYYWSEKQTSDFLEKHSEVPRKHL